jgi:hypothetical protein
MTEIMNENQSSSQINPVACKFLIGSASLSKSTYLANGSIANYQNFEQVVVGECLRRWGGHGYIAVSCLLERNEIGALSRMIVATEHTTAKTSQSHAAPPPGLNYLLSVLVETLTVKSQ